MPEENYPRQLQTFDVVLLKEGKHPLNAEPEDYKRVSVSATDTLAAQLSDELKPYKEGFVVQFATTPGMLTEPEILARRRRMDAPTCRSCLQTPCSCRKGG